MQFVYGSGHQGYGFIHLSDVDLKEAEAIRKMVNFSIPDNADFYGYLPFGTNNNRSLLFRIAKDSNYNRSAYYLHAIFDDDKAVGTPGDYFNKFGKSFLDTFRISFANQESLDKIRDKDEGICGELSESDPFKKWTVKEDFTDAGQVAYIENIELLIDIISELYCGSSVVIKIEDSKFSNSYARGVAEYIFGFLPPSLRKECSYITNSADIGSFRIRIVSERTVVDQKARVFCIDREYTPKASRFRECAACIVKIGVENPSELENWFLELEAFTNGYGTRFSLSKLEAIFNIVINGTSSIPSAVQNDCLAFIAEKILDEALKGTTRDVTDFEKCPRLLEIIKRLVVGNHNGGKDLFGLEISSLEEAFSPSVILKKRSIEIKKILLLAQDRDKAHKMLLRPYKSFFDSLEITESVLKDIEGFRNRGFVKPKDEGITYRSEFYEAYGRIFDSFIPDLLKECCEELKFTQRIASEYLGLLHYRIESENLSETVKAILRRLETDRKYVYLVRINMYNYIKAIIHDLIIKHNEAYKNKRCDLMTSYGCANKNPYTAQKAHYSEASTASSVRLQIDAGSYDTASKGLTDLIERNAEGAAEIINLSLYYAKCFRQSHGDRENTVYPALSKRKTMFREFVLKASEDGSSDGLALLICYSSVKDIFSTLISFVDYGVGKVNLCEEIRPVLGEMRIYLAERLTSEGELSDTDKKEICEIVKKAMDDASNELRRNIFFREYINAMVCALKDTNNDCLGLKPIKRFGVFGLNI